MRQFEPTGDGSWMYLTSGVTEPAIQGVHEFVSRFVDPNQGWKFTGVRLRPRTPVQYVGFTVEEDVVAFDFKRHTPQGRVENRSLYTDGFTWGYAGEGPRGLCKCLTTLCTIYVCPMSASLSDALWHWVRSRDRNQSYTLLSDAIPTFDFLKLGLKDMESP
mgnify:CR=1 FL=1